MWFSSSGLLLASIVAVLCSFAPTVVAEQSDAEQVALGRALFFDNNLSRNRSASCASCHNPGAAFSDSRPNASSAGNTPGAVSVGADGVTFGTRNAPALTYVALTPAFHRRDDGSFIGGFFVDGRADTLAAQARGPILNPRELALPDEATLAARLRMNERFIAGMRNRHNAATLEDDEKLNGLAMAALAAFQGSAEFSTFDSRYDRYLAGEYSMTREEAVGRDLFFSDLTNCSLCHLANRDQRDARETFTSSEYHNIGVPTNNRLTQAGETGKQADIGLAIRPEASAVDRGKFRTPSLRNVAVTAPYMHNGVFSTLEAAVLFYGRHLVDQSIASVNPETNSPWREPEVAATVEKERLMQGQPLDHTRTRQLVAFLKTLTDRRYEHLLDR
jgi:cytochrome c peroxidase